MKVSIVTISFNQAPFLEQAIRSVLDQDYPDIEYIVVDPGSTDGSRGIIKHYASQIDKIILEPDSGPADGLNKGFATATGDIFGFLNSDDVIEQSCLSRVVQWFLTRRDIDILSGHGVVIDADGSKIRYIYSDKFSLYLASHGASILVQPSTFFRRRIYERVGGFNIANRSNWDGELFVDMALSNAKFLVVPEYFSQYRVHVQGITGSAKLIEQHKAHAKNMFKKIRGREPNIADAPIRSVSRGLRKIINWRDTLERIKHGPVFGAAR